MTDDRAKEPTVIRWVALKVVVGAEGAKAAEFLGEIVAPDLTHATWLARHRFGPVTGGELSVISRLSWDMSEEERARLGRRSAPHLGSLNRRGGAPRRNPRV